MDRFSPVDQISLLGVWSKSACLDISPLEIPLSERRHRVTGRDLSQVTTSAMGGAALKHVGDAMTSATVESD